MNSLESVKLIKTVRGLWPKWDATEAEIEMWGRKLAHLDLGIALAAVEQHRLDSRVKNDPSLGGVLDCLGSEGRKTGPVESGSTVDNYRRQHGITGEMPAHEVIVRHHRSLWIKAQKRESYRGYLASNCRNTLISEGGVEYAAAVEMTEGIFEEEVP